MQAIRLLLISLLVIPGITLAGAPPQGGLDPARDIAQYAHRAWTKRDGLPQNTVEAIAQTPDGYLWFGTVEGLVRFDGTSFRVFNVRNTPQLTMNYISSLCVTRDSSMYVGTYAGTLVRWYRGAFRRVPPPRRGEHMMVRRIYEDRHGEIWVATTNGLLQVRGDSVHKVFTVADGLPMNAVHGVCESSDGRLFLATPLGIWVRAGDCFEPWMKGPKLKPMPPYDFAFERPEVLGSTPTDILCDGRGGLWIGTRGTGLFRYAGGTLTSFAATRGLEKVTVVRLFEDRNGSVWIGTMARGLWRYARGTFSSFTSADGLSGDEVMSLFEDREGNLWAGVSTGGVNMFTNSTFSTFRIGTTLMENMVWSLGEGPRGEVVASTASGDIFVLDGKHFTRSAAMSKQHNGIIAAYLQGRDGDYWIGGSDGLVRFKDGAAKKLSPLPVTTMARDGVGRIWIGGARGVAVVRGDELVPAFPGMMKNLSDTRQLLFDGDSTMYIVTRTFGLGRFTVPRGRGSVVLDSADVHWSNLGNDAGAPWILSASRDTLGTLWVTTMGSGLKVVRGSKVFTLTPADGIPEEVMYIAMPDGAGNMWFSSNNGVYRAAATDLYDLLEGRAKHVSFDSYGTSDGMYSDECNGGHQASGLRTRDGRLWFPTTAGVVMVDPHRMPVNNVPPAVVIERMLVDNKEGSVVPGTRYEPGNGELEFHFIGLSYAAPERVRYRYLLEGFNKQWIDAGNRHEAFYTNIPPGSYRFRVQAVNASGTWNELGAAVAFTLEPHFRQTPWFVVLVAGLAGGMILLGLFAYKRYRDREVVASRLESELARAQVQILEMQLQPHFLFNTLNSIMVLIRQDADMASRMVARLSEFLRLTLDSAGMQEVTLRRELEFLEKYLHIERIRFGDRLQIEQHVDPALLDALVPNLILQPLVENAIRHGVSKRRGPAVISVSAERSNGSVLVHVRDNGAGLPSREGGIREGIGIRNTRQRLRHLYGDAFEFRLESPPEGGVDVHLTFPFHDGSTQAWNAYGR